MTAPLLLLPGEVVIVGLVLFGSMVELGAVLFGSIVWFGLVLFGSMIRVALLLFGIVVPLAPGTVVLVVALPVALPFTVPLGVIVAPLWTDAPAPFVVELLIDGAFGIVVPVLMPPALPCCCRSCA